MSKIKILLGAVALALPLHYASAANELNVNPATSTYRDQAASQDSIRQAQEALNLKGYSVNADGIMGPRTTDALRKYQTENSINQSGQLDQATLQSLGLSQSPGFERAPASVPQNQPGTLRTPAGVNNPSGLSTPNDNTTAPIQVPSGFANPNGTQSPSGTPVPPATTP